MRVSRVSMMVGLLLVPGFAAAQSARLAGLWQGDLVRGSRTQPVVLVCLPRGSTGVTGSLAFDNQDLGAVEESRVTADSLTFHVGPYRFAAAGAGERLACAITVLHGNTYTLTLTRTSADTTRLPESAGAPAPLRIPSAPDAVYRTHTLAASNRSSTHSALVHGTLFLVGGGAGQADLNDRFVQLAGGASARILDLPDAAMALRGTTEPPDGRALAAILGTRVEVMHARSREEADSASFVIPLGRVRGVWIDGGEARAIVDRYLGTRTEKSLLEFLDRGGVIGGTSAGAIMWGSHLMIFRADASGNPYAGMSADALVPGDPHEPGFGVLRNVVVVAHYSEFKLEPAVRRMLAAHPGILAIGIDEATAFEVHRDVGIVRGRGHVTVFDGNHPADSPLVLGEGARYDIPQRSVVGDSAAGRSRKAPATRTSSSSASR